jgi:hypothetical protein
MGVLATEAMKNANGGRRDYDIGSTTEMLSVGLNTSYKTSGKRPNGDTTFLLCTILL